ncbi:MULTISPECIES: exodeoxyribonuclease V subunit alpha [unclassified Dyella]|uniref:exodeoxyribonuclease V subunit alpha n=1 Tax=unclassified Dyella TaxID=2634549 RepID=UPI000C85ACF2|nr:MULTISPECIES: exodeoxyribonuclease V subunit alpha [unclassified Dyella]MDR3445822.1 exodeoxyribonuclease V subunit alpha [Dyella sp.]PMQ04335.1 RecBCD enzyme subunit RecD [Dyella sp. AD56]
MSPESRLTSMEQAIERNWLRPLDVAFARFLDAQDPNAPPALPLLGALVSRQQADGHLCLDLSSWESLADDGGWPSDWKAMLAEAARAPSTLLSSMLLAAIDDPARSASPLVLDGDRLYLRRYWNHEQRVAQAISQRLANTWEASPLLSAQLTRLFPAVSTEAPDWQRVACALAARGAFTVITGGPGTGKTTTVVRLLGLLQTLHRKETARPLRIRLAAPTGKAAARLQSSISTQIAQLDVDSDVRASIPSQVDTLHRLLGARPDTRRFRHDASHPLHLDVLVIDEASMIDLEMMSAVLAALPDNARLILLGDKDQLSSVEAGAVLGDLCRRAEAGHYSAATAAWLRDTTGDRIDTWVCDDARALDQHVAMLRHSHRFGADSGIGTLAQRVNEGDATQVQALLSKRLADIAWVDAAADARTLTDLVLDGGASRFLPRADGEQPHGYRHYIEWLRCERPSAAAAPDVFDAWARGVLRAFGSFQLLCALRQGSFGAEGLNRQIAGILHQAQLIDSSHEWYEGRPVLVTRNDYSLGLMNGDVGIALRVPDEQGVMQLRVAFEVAGDAADHASRIRFVLPSRLSERETVYAMTVHKSQGSEFDHAALVLPAEANAVLTRELLYTGITRARRWFSLLTPAAIVRQSVEQPVHRHSGLYQRWSSADAHQNSSSARD